MRKEDLIGILFLILCILVMALCFVPPSKTVPAAQAADPKLEKEAKELGKQAFSMGSPVTVRDFLAMSLYANGNTLPNCYSMADYALLEAVRQRKR